MMNLRTIIKGMSVVFPIVGLTGFSRVMLADIQPAPTRISGDWLLDVRTLCAVGAVVLVGTWRLSRWMKGIDDKLANMVTREQVNELIDKRIRPQLNER